MAFNKKSFLHDTEAISLQLKRIETNLRVIENSIKRQRDELDYIKKIMDGTFKEIYPLLED